MSFHIGVTLEYNIFNGATGRCADWLLLSLSPEHKGIMDVGRIQVSSRSAC